MVEAAPAAIESYLEIGRQRVFAGALAWPGWCRAGRDEVSALATLARYGPRYADVVRRMGLGFIAPAGADGLCVVERLTGNATTDFGAPALAPSSDAGPISETDLTWLVSLLRACWAAFDAAVRAADGRELQKGPRGGGRTLEAIVDHVLAAEAGYLGRLAGTAPGHTAGGPADGRAEMRAAVEQALAATASGRVAPTGPRGGARWSGRYFVRRAAWHVLDHAWELQDRTIA